MQVKALIESTRVFVVEVNTKSFKDAKEMVLHASDRWIRLHGTEVRCVDYVIKSIEPIDEEE